MAEHEHSAKEICHSYDQLYCLGCGEEIDPVARIAELEAALAAAEERATLAWDSCEAMKEDMERKLATVTAERDRAWEPFL